MGYLLRDTLKSSGWKVINDTPLPLGCFSDEKQFSDPGFARSICDRVIKSGEAWLPVYPVNGLNTLRACITNYWTSDEDINALVDTVNKVRSDLT